jgi:RimJ/RimL family protein N-acetyltransferase
MAYPLLTQRLSIEPLAAQDLIAFVTYRQDPDVARFQGWDSSYSEHQARKLIDSQANVLLPVAGDWLQLAIHDRVSGELLGDLALNALEDAEFSFEIGFTLSKINQGKGFGIEAVGCLVDYLFCEIGAKRLVATCDQRNSPAIKLASSLGFVHKPERSWTENFKNEKVTVDYFEMTSGSKNRN